VLLNYLPFRRDGHMVSAGSFNALAKAICVLTADPPGLIYDPNMIDSTNMASSTSQLGRRILEQPCAQELATYALQKYTNRAIKILGSYVLNTRIKMTELWYV
jgi:hypothetical protein